MTEMLPISQVIGIIAWQWEIITGQMEEMVICEWREKNVKLNRQGEAVRA